MTTETATYDQVSVPTCTVTKTTSDTTGAVLYSVSVDLLEIAPGRSVTAEERAKGISSINPPTVSSRVPNELIRLAVEACCSAYDETDGFGFDAESLAYMSMRVSYSVAQALRSLGVAV